MRSTLYSLLAVLILAGCASDNKSGDSSDFKPPFKGETMAQVRSQYDDPSRVNQNSDGVQTWVYVLGKGRMFIPYYGAFTHPTILLVTFDSNGNVSSWSTSQ
jgi:hypothetical protein